MKGRAPACLAAGVVLGALCAIVSADGARRSAPRCAPSHGDVLCVLQPLVRIGAKPKSRHKVKAGTARRVNGGSTITLTKRGVASLYLGRAAQCRNFSRNRRVTQVLTRRPASFLFTQLRGDALCTMADLRIVLVRPGTGVLGGAAYSARQKARFFASLEAAAGSAGGASEYRVRFSPRTSFAVATHRGKILVRLSTDQVYPVAAGQQLTVALRHGKPIKPAAVGVAHFPASEEAVFGKQLQLPDLAVTIRSASVSCPGGAGTCQTTVVYAVRNQGRASALDFRVLVEANPGLGVNRTVAIRILQPGGSRTLKTSVGPDGNCFDPDCSVRVTVDPADRVLELDDQNNVATETIPG